MTRYRPIKKIGNSWFIKLEPTDIRDFNLNANHRIDIEDCIVLNYVKRKKTIKKGEKKGK